LFKIENIVIAIRLLAEWQSPCNNQFKGIASSPLAGGSSR